MTITKNDTTVAKDGVLAVSLDPAFAAQVKEAAQREGTSGAHFARLALADRLTAMGFTVAPIVESKKGPKAGAKVNPEAAKYNLSNAEYSRRVNVHLRKGLTLKEIGKLDLSVDPAPVKHREPKAPEAPAA